MDNFLGKHNLWKLTSVEIENLNRQGFSQFTIVNSKGKRKKWNNASPRDKFLYKLGMRKDFRLDKFDYIKAKRISNSARYCNKC